MLIPRKQHCAGPVCEVICDPRAQTVTLEEPGHRSDLVMTDLDSRDPLFIQDPWELRRKDAISIKAALSRKQRLVRLIFAYAPAKVGAIRDIGRIAKDEIEPILKALCPIAVAQPEIGR